MSFGVNHETIAPETKMAHFCYPLYAVMTKKYESEINIVWQWSSMSHARTVVNSPTTTYTMPVTLCPCFINFNRNYNTCNVITHVKGTIQLRLFAICHWRIDSSIINRVWIIHIAVCAILTHLLCMVQHSIELQRHGIPFAALTHASFRIDYIWRRLSFLSSARFW